MITKENLKLIDVKTDFEYKFKCSNCNRKLKNAYILNNGDVLGSECILKVLENNFETENKLYELNNKLKKIKNLLTAYFEISSQLKKDIYSKDYPYCFENGDSEDAFYIDAYKNKEDSKDCTKRIFNICGTYKKLKEFEVYLNKNPSYIILIPQIKNLLEYEQKIKTSPEWNFKK